MRRLNTAIDAASDVAIYVLVGGVGLVLPMVALSVEFVWWAGLLLLIPGVIVAALVWLYG